MSVPVPNRGQGELEVNTKARELTVYTLRILENEKWFPQSQRAFIEMLQNCAIEIQALCWEANNIRVDGNEQEYGRRLRLQKEAASKCNRMSMLIETAKPLFHLRSKRVRYWINLTKELRKTIKGWHDSDVKRLAPKKE